MFVFSAHIVRYMALVFSLMLLLVVHVIKYIVEYHKDLMNPPPFSMLPHSSITLLPVTFPYGLNIQSNQFLFKLLLLSMRKRNILGTFFHCL